MPFKARGSGNYASWCIMPAETLISLLCVTAMSSYSVVSLLVANLTELNFTIFSSFLLCFFVLVCHWCCLAVLVAFGSFRFIIKWNEKWKCLLYGLEVCLVNASDISSLGFVIKHVFMKLFHTEYLCMLISSLLDLFLQCLFVCYYLLANKDYRYNQALFTTRARCRDSWMCQQISPKSAAYVIMFSAKLSRNWSLYIRDKSKGKCTYIALIFKRLTLR